MKFTIILLAILEVLYIVIVKLATFLVSFTMLFLCSLFLAEFWREWVRTRAARIRNGGDSHEMGT